MKELILIIQQPEVVFRDLLMFIKGVLVTSHLWTLCKKHSSLMILLTHFIFHYDSVAYGFLFFYVHLFFFILNILYFYTLQTNTFLNRFC